jgi:hypothetical protein
MIAALPKIVCQHPDVLYLIANQTHPAVRPADGEGYRNGLVRLVAELDLSNHVRFLDRPLELLREAGMTAATVTRTP